jgi:TRAP-type C4-dicarboxylate transport system permease large subunit
LSQKPPAALAITIVAFIIPGSVLEGLPAIVLFGPLLFPVAKAMGVHEVHYAMIVILARGIGLFAPPFGVGYYSACAIGRISPDAALWRIWPYIGALANRRRRPLAVDRLPLAAVAWGPRPACFLRSPPLE